MRLKDPRIEPLADDEMTPEQAQVVAPILERGGTVPNVIPTLMRHMPLFDSLNELGGHILSGNSLDPREREILIMRVAWNTRCEYQWGQHVRMSQPAGLDAGDHARIQAGPEAEGWSELDAALLRAADELTDETIISDATWATLEKHLSTEQLIDVIFTVGHYHMVAMALNSIGVQPESDLAGFDG